MSLLKSVEFQKAEAKAEATGDYSKVLSLIVPLAENGNAEAQCYLASMYHLGIGVCMDGSSAVHWYELAAHQGYSLASNNLSSLYAAGGPNLVANPELSIYWRKKSLAQGFPS
ncbi:tetratricopeptide repeat protein [Novimethylophilus kurashikiensis]|uniref:tetratricopeptide repeat protein n=1 Tax=Novimethylophilus kurashikiensis TaxID=1825523 RepID=UPI000D597F19|nr:SEL1-like repeat protein [Novimethylophilus kurashikiensis]